MVNLGNSKHSLACNLEATETGDFDRCICGLAAARKSKTLETATTPTPFKLGIAIDLRELDKLSKKYIASLGGVDETLTEATTLSLFLLWLRRKHQAGELYYDRFIKKENSDGKKPAN